MATSRDTRQMMLGQIFSRPFIPRGLDLSDKTIVVTGANTGLGFECAKHLAKLKVSKLILGCRSIDKGNRAKEQILSDTAARFTDIEVWEIDQCKYASVIAFGKRVRTTLSRLDGFICNAGVAMRDYTGAEDLETTITINVISTMLLAISVLPKLRETSASLGGIPTNLSIVGSSVHIFGEQKLLVNPSLARGGKPVDTFDAVSDPNFAVMSVPGNPMSPQYTLSKTLLHALAAELAARSSRPDLNERVTVNWLNPGWCVSDIDRHDKNQPQGFFARLLRYLIQWTTEQGSRTLVHAVQAGPDTHGCYLSECRTRLQSDFLRSHEGGVFQKRLWSEFVARAAKISPETVTFV